MAKISQSVLMKQMNREFNLVRLELPHVVSSSYHIVLCMLHITPKIFATLQHNMTDRVYINDMRGEGRGSNDSLASHNWLWFLGPLILYSS